MYEQETVPNNEAFVEEIGDDAQSSAEDANLNVSSRKEETCLEEVLQLAHTFHARPYVLSHSKSIRGRDPEKKHWHCLQVSHCSWLCGCHTLSEEHWQRHFSSYLVRSAAYFAKDSYPTTDFEPLVNGGEMLVVLGPPGSGCSTL